MARATREKREEILSVAALLFSERGAVSVTMRDIAHAAKTSTANIFYHFESKEALRKEVVQWASESMMSRRHTIFNSALPANEKLKLMVFDVINGNLNDPIRRNIIIREIIDSEYGKTSEYIIETQKDITTKGIIDIIISLRPEADPYHVFDVISCFGFGFPSFRPLISSLRPITDDENDPEFLTNLILSFAIPGIEWPTVALNISANF